MTSDLGVASHVNWVSSSVKLVHNSYTGIGLALPYLRCIVSYFMKSDLSVLDNTEHIRLIFNVTRVH